MTADTITHVFLCGLGVLFVLAVFILLVVDDHDEEDRYH